MPIADWLPYESPLYINYGIGLKLVRLKPNWTSVKGRHKFEWFI